jgi:phosphoglucosamine mutase
MAKYFGTDGVRGIANTELSAELSLKLGAASAFVLRRKHEGAKILIGRDPRISGDILESAMASGICSMGVDVHLAGVIPTPAVAFLAQSMHADAGVVISASHNPMRDNGIKFFGENGFKLPDEIESEIEQHVDAFDALPRPSGDGVGRMYREHDLLDLYLDHLRRCFTHRLDGMNIVLDCANGAAFEAAPRLFAELGADTTVINDQPNGININLNCGSLHTQSLKKLVIETGAPVGMAFDGDADRSILIDEKGRTVDGDHVMAICALHLARQGRLPHNKVVATVMSNIGLEIALKREGIELLRTSVGDRYVSDELRRTGATIGGEKSGHLIFTEYSTTGDGIVTALQVLNVMIETGKPLSELVDQMVEFPQILINVPVRDKTGWETNPEIAASIAAAESSLDGRGRVLVRASGTERLIRVMAEGPDQTELEQIAAEVCTVIKHALG